MHKVPPVRIPGNYSRVSLSADEIASEAYKNRFGGGKEKWDLRGAFQLYFLKEMGLRPSHAVLDIGCGPLRGGVHIIRYLLPNRYHGVDSNRDFLEVGRAVVSRDPVLAAKHPTLQVVKNFELKTLDRFFDYVLLFSVLNHCGPAQRALFVESLPSVLARSGHAYFTHGWWFDETILAGSPVRVTRRLTATAQIAAGLRLADWGWSGGESIFPIFELGL